MSVQTINTPGANEIPSCHGGLENRFDILALRAGERIPVVTNPGFVMLILIHTATVEKAIVLRMQSVQNSFVLRMQSVEGT